MMEKGLIKRTDPDHPQSPDMSYYISDTMSTIVGQGPSHILI